MNQEINVLALVKGAERYIFAYDDASREETLRVLGRDLLQILIYPLHGMMLLFYLKE